MTDSEAIALCQEGDRGAFRHLVDQYQDVLFGTALLMTGNRALAEEQVQEALLSAWRGIRGFQTGRPVKPWLVRILVNTVLAQQRKRSLPTVSLTDAEPHPGDDRDPLGAVEELEDRLAVRRAVDGLNQEQRQVVVLRYFAGLTIPEISRSLGIREGTVKSRLHRSLAQLRRLLEDSGVQPLTIVSKEGG